MGWSEKYKKSINCNNPKGFSQKAHCAGKKKNEEMVFEEITEDILNEKLITYGNRKPYGQIVFMAGGAGSGKGFAIKNFVDSASFKIRDVDEMKKQLQILNRLGKLDIRSILKKYGRNIKLKDLDLIRKIEKDGYKLQNLNLKNPDHVYALHILVKAMGIKDNTLEKLLLGKNNTETLPNILFDITAKDVTDITNVIPKLKAVGYKPENIHLTWVLTNYITAMANNKNRSRMVPEDILLKTHEGAANTIWGLVTKALPKGMNGRVDVILNNPENTVFLKGADGKDLEKTQKDKSLGKGKDVKVKFTSGFLSLPLKKEKGGIYAEKVWKDKLFKWVKGNAPDSITANMEESVNERADYTYLTQVILDAKPKYNVYYNRSNNVVNIGGVGYDKGELVRQFNQKPGSSSNIKNNFFHANKDPQKTKREVEKLSNGKIKVTFGKGYGNEPIVYYSLKESVNEATLSQIHKAAKKGSYPVSIVATMLGKVVKQELVKTPMAVPAAFMGMQGAYPKARISVESRTGQILFQEAKLNNMGQSINEISAIKGLKQVVNGNTKEVEGIKVSKEMAQAMIDWFNSSPYGRKYPKAKNARLHISIGVMLSFGLDRYAKHKGAKEELKYLKSMKEAYKGNMSDFKYEFPNTFEDETGNSTKAIKKVSKKGKGYEVRTSTYMSEPEMKKVGDALGLKLVNYQKSGNIAITLYESVSENFTPEQAYNGLFKFKHKGKKYVGQVGRKDGGKYVLSLHDIGLLSIPDVSPNDMEYLGNVSDQGKKGLPYLSAHPKNFQKVQNGQFYKELVFKGGVKASLPSYISNSQLKDINKYYRLKLTKDDLKLESVNEGISVFDERHFGKKGIIIMIDDNGKKVSAIFKDKKNADKFNRNNPSDIKKLLDLAKKTKYPKAIDESVNEANYKVGDTISVTLKGGKKVIKGKVEKLNPLKVRTGPTDVVTLGNHLIQSISESINEAKAFVVMYKVKKDLPNRNVKPSSAAYAKESDAKKFLKSVEKDGGKGMIVKSNVSGMKVNEAKDEVTPKQLLKIQNDVRKVNRKFKVYISKHPVDKGKLNIELGHGHDNDDDIHKIYDILKKHTGSWKTGSIFNESVLSEGMFGLIDQIRQDSKDVRDFVNNVFKDREFKNMKNDKDFIKYLKSIYEGFSSDAQRKAAFANGYDEKGKKKNEEITIEEKINLFVEKNVPTDPGKWSYYKAQAKKKFDVYPSAYANGWAAKKYKAAGGGWKKEK